MFVRERPLNRTVRKLRVARSARIEFERLNPSSEVSN